MNKFQSFDQQQEKAYDEQYRTASQGCAGSVRNGLATERRPEIGAQFERLQTLVGLLGDSLELLEKRLVPVMRSTPLATDSLREAVREAGTPMGNSLRDVADRLDRLNANVAAMLVLIEL